MIVGTAGHIDHGKTALVRALTGVETDRLKEEKTRGISIELGYAYTALEHGDVLGFVDVPGHERLVHTMVAGATGIDFALLVVAADDGVMPQTREHLAILELLGITRGAVALTKVDRVDDQRLRQVQAELTAELAPTALRAAPVFPLNALAPDDPGTAALRRHLHDAAAHNPVRQDDALFRLAVDRVFTLTGHGVVTTGTVFSGRIRTGDTLVVMPSGTPARVRGIHAQNQASDSGHAGQRCAINVAGVDKDSISRGDWLADPRLFAPTTRIDVRLRLLAGSNLRLAPWAPLHVHMGTTHRVAHVVPLESGTLSAGDSGARAAGLRRAGLCGLWRSLHRARCAGHAHGRRRRRHRPVRAVAKTTLGRPTSPSRRARTDDRGRRDRAAAATCAPRFADDGAGAPDRPRPGAGSAPARLADDRGGTRTFRLPPVCVARTAPACGAHVARVSCPGTRRARSRCRSPAPHRAA